MQIEVHDRGEILNYYLRACAAELVKRGIVDFQTGCDPLEILKRRPGEVVGMMLRDLKEQGLSVTGEILRGVASGILGAVFK